MKIGNVLKNLGKLFKDNPDQGVPEVALYVAGLDGKLLPEEIETYKALAAKCEGYDVNKAAETFEKALHEVGYLMTLAVPGVSSASARVSAFLAAAAKSLPADFGVKDIQSARFAFALWTAMAMSDGEFAGIEKDALDMLKLNLVSRVEARLRTVTSKSLVSKDALAAVDDFRKSDFVQSARMLLAD